MSSSLLLYVCCLFISPGQSHYGLHQQPIRFRVLSNFWPIRFCYMIEKTIKIYFHTNGKNQNTHKKIIIWFTFLICSYCIEKWEQRWEKCKQTLHRVDFCFFYNTKRPFCNKRWRREQQNFSYLVCEKNKIQLATKFVLLS